MSTAWEWGTGILFHAGTTPGFNYPATDGSGVILHNGLIWNQQKPKVEFTKDILEKAEAFLQKTIPYKVFAMLEHGEMVSITANNRHTYFMNRNGRIGKCKTSRIFTNVPKEYGQLKSDTLPMDDLIASFYIWVTTNASDLEKKWGCGNITINDKTE